MTSLTLPDVNVWLALASPEHVHSQEAKRWWQRETGLIALCRFTQLGLLRLMTTAVVMGGRPLSLDDAWLLAFAQASGGKLLTFDRALAARGAQCLL